MWKGMPAGALSSSMGLLQSIGSGAFQDGSANAWQGSFGNSVNVQPEKNQSLRSNTAWIRATPLKFCPSRTALPQPYISYSVLSAFVLRSGRNASKSGLVEKSLLCAACILAANTFRSTLSLPVSEMKSKSTLHFRPLWAFKYPSKRFASASRLSAGTAANHSLPSPAKVIVVPMHTTAQQSLVNR